MIKHSTFVAAVLYMLAASGCGIGLQAVPGASVPDDDDVADDDDSSSTTDDDDSTANDDDSTLADDDDSVDDDDASGDDDDGGGCTALTALSCGQQISATTLDPGATDNIDTWGCSGWANSGPELAYSFNTNAATTVVVELTSMESGQDLDVYVTSDSGIGCHSGDCAAFGDVEAEFEAAPGIDYFVVVDGYQGAAGTFVLDVSCASTGDDDDSVGDDDDSVGDDDDATTTGPEVCTNLIDDDGNGLIDCQDPACATDPACAPPAEDCVNGFDDDGDGLVDCDDPGCSSDPACAAAAENCSNGIDDDGNGLVDCDDSACAADPACQSSGGGSCTPDWVLVENSTDSWNNGGIGSTNNIDTYSCVGWDESGPEYTYSYTAASTGTATVSVSVSGWLNFDDLDVFVLDGSGACDPNNCVTYGDSSASWAVTAGSSWFIVVDGYLGDTSDYDIELTFSP